MEEGKVFGEFEEAAEDIDRFRGEIGASSKNYSLNSQGKKKDAVPSEPIPYCQRCITKREQNQ